MTTNIMITFSTIFCLFTNYIIWNFTIWNFEQVEKRKKFLYNFIHLILCGCSLFTMFILTATIIILF